MKLKIRNKINFLWLSLIAMLLFAFIFAIYKKEVKGGVDYHCSTSFLMQRSNPDFTGRLNLFLKLQKNGSAFFDVSGNVNYLGKKYDVARMYNFKYERKGEGFYHLIQLNISRRSADNIDDGLMDRFFISTTQKEGNYIHMVKIKNAYVIYTLYSPAFICINN